MRRRGVLVRVFRMVFVTLVMTVTLVFILRTDTSSDSQGLLPITYWYIPLTMSILLTAGVVVLDIFTPRRLSTLSGIVIGMLAGLVATFAMSFVIDLLAQAWELDKTADFKTLVFSFKVVLGMCLCFLAISTVLQTQDDFRLVIPYVEFAKQIRGPKPMLLDTSALIDGRIADLAGTPLLAVPVVIPSFVLLELQALSDSSDKHKRARGRRGLEIVTRLKRTAGLDLTIDDTPVPGKAVDQMLVELARVMPAAIVTTDSGLSRLASINNVSVVNLHEVSGALKQVLVPGTIVSVELVRRGEQAHQAVGYLDDGAMVVADHGVALLGTRATLEVQSTLQTTAGRLVFARPVTIGDNEGRSVLSPGAGGGDGPSDGRDGGAPERGERDAGASGGANSTMPVAAASPAATPAGAAQVADTGAKGTSAAAAPPVNQTVQAAPAAPALPTSTGGPAGPIGPRARPTVGEDDEPRGWGRRNPARNPRR